MSNLEIFSAVRRGDLAEVKQFLDEDGDIEIVGGRFHGTLLIESCRYHMVKVAELLLSRDAAVNASGGGSWTPLHYACDGGEAASLVLQLIAHGGDVRARDFQERTPLHIAARHGASNSMIALLEADAAPNAQDADGRTPMHYASLQGWREAIAVLLSFGADASAADRELATPLHLATLNRHFLVMNLLTRAGADSNAVDCWGRLAGTLAPAFKMWPRRDKPLHQGQIHCESAEDGGGIANTGPCVACSARNGRHYYFCRIETLENTPSGCILGADGYPVDRSDK